MHSLAAHFDESRCKRIQIPPRHNERTIPPRVFLFRVGAFQFLPPKISRLSVILQYFLFLLWIIQLDSPRPFGDPIHEELGRLLTHPRLIADLDIVGTCTGEPKCLAVAGHCLDQKPTAPLELERWQASSGLGKLVEPYVVYRMAVLYDFQILDRIARR